jgi:hypothetical protein
MVPASCLVGTAILVFLFTLLIVGRIAYRDGVECGYIYANSPLLLHDGDRRDIKRILSSITR